MTEKKSGLARYENVSDGYLEKRKLRKSAGWKLLWALGVGAVISGDFFGWNFGLAEGGFGGLGIATLLMAVMYICMVFTIAELSAALPHAGGFYSFVRQAMGPTAGYVCGLTDTIEYVVTPAVVVVGIAGYFNELLASIFGMDSSQLARWAPLWWLVAYGIFLWINVRGVELTLKVGLVVTVVAIAVLAIFYASVLLTGSFDAEKLVNIEPQSGGSRWLPMGWMGVFAALPFAIWFYLAIEQLPLAAEETHDVVRDMPKALIFGMGTLLLLSALTLVLNTGVGGGAAALGASGAPLADGFQSVLSDHTEFAVLITLLTLTGLIASFHTIIYAYGRVLFALSRAGYFPRWISPTSRHHTPHVALILGAVVGIGCALAIHLAGGEKSKVGAVLLNMAVFGAVISYAMVMFSFIRLRLTRPELPRPYRSPLGIPGAALGAALSLVALGATLANKDMRPGIYGVMIFLVVGLVYYLLHSRRYLVAQAPEEEVALISEAERELGQGS